MKEEKMIEIDIFPVIVDFCRRNDKYKKVLKSLKKLEDFVSKNLCITCKKIIYFKPIRLCYGHTGYHVRCSRDVALYLGISMVVGVCL